MKENRAEQNGEVLDAQKMHRDTMLKEVMAQSLVYLAIYTITYGYVYFFPTTTVLTIVMQYANTIGAAIVGGVFATSEYKIRYFYPLLAGLIFLPLVFILYNKTALDFCLNYIIAAYLGFLVVTVFRMVRRIFRKAGKNMGWEQNPKPQRRKK